MRRTRLAQTPRDKDTQGSCAVSGFQRPFSGHPWNPFHTRAQGGPSSGLVLLMCLFFPAVGDGPSCHCRVAKSPHTQWHSSTTLPGSESVAQEPERTDWGCLVFSSLPHRVWGLSWGHGKAERGWTAGPWSHPAPGSGDVLGQSMGNRVWPACGPTGPGSAAPGFWGTGRGRGTSSLSSALPRDDRHVIVYV